MYTDNPRIQQLMIIGQPDWSCEWPDYVAEYQLGARDVPDLVALFEVDPLEPDEDQAPEMWASLHAWRALGQIGDPAAIAPIISSFDTRYDDDAALEELGKVMGMFGAQAIAPLTEYWQRPGKDEFAYVMAMDSLAEIAAQHADTRNQVLEVFTRYLAQPEQAFPMLNALLVAHLVELGAREYIDDIRRLFTLECVDLGCIGDIEDVEIALGLCQERSTPRPDPGAALRDTPFPSDLPEPDDDDFLGILNYTLYTKGGEHAIYDVSELDGFFAAIACAPQLVTPSTWMPAIWGGSEQAPDDWDSKQEFERFATALFAYYNMVVDGLNEDDYEPLFLENTRGDASVLVVDEWCEGFMRGVCLWGDSITEQDMRVLEECLAPIQLFTGAVDYETRLALPASDIEALQQSIYPSVLRLYRYFFQALKRPNTTFIHTSPKTGRNEPCPCGSGKKYKKCCGLN